MGGKPVYARRARAVELRLAGYSRNQIAKELGLKSSGCLSKWLKGVPPSDTTRRPKAHELKVRSIELREKGYSYREITLQTGVAKSTLSQWLKDIPLTEEQREALADKKIQGNKRRAAAVSAQAAATRARIRAEASKQVPLLSANPLFVAGVVAYWAEGAKEKPWRRSSRVVFMNSDPDLIRLFLAWLDLVGVERDRLRFAIHIHEKADVERALTYWSELVGEPADQFQKTTLKKEKPKTVRKNTGEGYYGCLRISVCRATYFYCQIAGWFDGIMAAVPVGSNLRLAY